MDVITCEAVHRHFGEVRALNGIDLTVSHHQIFGLLGPNGSGKTTLLNQLQGLDRPTSGKVRVLGLDPASDHAELSERIGTQLQEATLIPRLKVAEVLRTFASFYRNPRDTDILIGRVGLEHKRNTFVSTLSGGQRQRLFIALALVNDAELIFFDELTSAVDPQARLAIWALLEELREEGRTLVITTHSMAEAQRLCDRVAIIDAGKIIAEGTVDALISAHTSGSSLRLHVDARVDLDALRALDAVSAADQNGNDLVIHGASDMAPVVLSTLSTAGITVSNMTMDDADLEDVFLSLTGRTMRDGD